MCVLVLGRGAFVVGRVLAVGELRIQGKLIAEPCFVVFICACCSLFHESSLCILQHSVLVSAMLLFKQ